jgi:hypothetical protein
MKTRGGQESVRVRVRRKKTAGNRTILAVTSGTSTTDETKNLPSRHRLAEKVRRRLVRSTIGDAREAATVTVTLVPTAAAAAAAAAVAVAAVAVAVAVIVATARIHMTDEGKTMGHERTIHPPHRPSIINATPRW